MSNMKDEQSPLAIKMGTPNTTHTTTMDLVQHLDTPEKTNKEVRTRTLIEQLNSPQKNNLPDKVKAINVSGLLNNCFFHSLALYYLGNKIPLPDDLFTYKSNDDNKDLVKLKTQFPNLESLEFFNKYALRKQSDDQYSNHWVEKAIVLGIFLRSYFVKLLLIDEKNSNDLFEYEGGEEEINEKQVTFMSLVGDYISSKADNALDTFEESVKDNPIYQANKDYFEKITKDAAMKTHKTYWFLSGYEKYCNYLNSETKISHVDVEPVLRRLGIPFNFYSYTDSSLIAEQSSKDEIPPFELAINVQEGHYYLYTSESTSPVLDEYKRQHQEYLDFREAVLATPTQDVDKITQAQNSSALFLAATIPSEQENHSPLKLIVERVEEMATALNVQVNNSEIKEELKGEAENVIEEKTVVTETIKEQNNLLEESPRNNSQNQLRSSGSSSDSNKNNAILNEIKVSPSSQTQDDKLEKEVKISPLDLSSLNQSTHGLEKKHSANGSNTPKPSPHSFRKKGNTEQIVQIHVARTCLNKLSQKAEDYKLKRENPPQNLTMDEKAKYSTKYQEAEEASSQLNLGLSLLLTSFENSAASVEDCDLLKTESLKLINLYKPILAKHRETNDTIMNFIDAIFGRGVIYGYVESILPQLLWKTSGAKAADNFMDSLEEIKPVPVI